MKIIGHRGARGLAPENTLTSLRKAIGHRVDAVEFDLRVTKDNIAILHHDPELVDPNGDKHKISKCDYAELKKHKKDLATFEEVLDQIGNQVILYPEIKPGEPTAQIIKAIRARLNGGWPPESFRLASFDIRILKELSAAFPDVQVTVLEKWSGIRAARHARQIGSKHIIMNQRWLWWGFIRQMARHGYRLGAYPLNDPNKARRWQRHGLRAVVTDYPDRFREYPRD